MIDIAQLTFWQKIKEIVVNPFGFFDEISDEEFRFPMLFIIFLQLLVAPLGIISSYLTGGETVAITILIYLISLVIGVLVFLLIVSIYHGIVYLFGSREGYTRTVQAFAYGSAPAVMLAWLPFANFVVAAYSMVIVIKGIEKLHKLPLWKAIVIYLIPVIALILLVLAVILLGFGSVPSV